ncbi:GDP-mannose 4,6-dehydratase [Marinilongibacter aquaticus]|uniref:NAD-dependent epimerase/dehydratase family protein n=1 Tax=Marinilongibacter aquaticus TaxID=2975157 RepID=UPI0021BD7D85|nr:NAD-dependent epimerase/dehydratase family protein [Marinilongibacter aquaticus]UBM58071.1 GDP-mannose 4,6-dehydratase [Marinilongibacter aquaticus]
MSKVLVTGAAGFIGFHVVQKLIKAGHEVFGLDNINDYYSPPLKYARLKECGIEAEAIKWYIPVQSNLFSNYHFVRMNLEDRQQLFALFQEQNFDYVINLAAQAGVRYSLENPGVYIQSNIVGFHNVLEACKEFPPKRLVHASSSSVYGTNDKIPFEEVDKTDSPVSLYASTKKSNELMAHCYSSLYKTPITCLRFFTVYGPWGRPDMAPMLFAKAISKGDKIKVFNNGNLMRDFTYIDDIANGTILALEVSNLESPNKDLFKVYNIGCSSPIKLMDFIQEIEDSFGTEANKDFLPMQPGDVYQTYADTRKLESELGYKPSVSLHEGVGNFAKWYNSEKNPLK